MLGLLTVVFATSCHNSKTKPEETPVYSVTSPIELDTTFTKDYIAQLQSIRNVELRAQEKGYLQNIYVDEGQHVRAGQTLFKIMPRLYEAEVLKAKAEVKSAETELLNTKILAGKQIVSQSEQTLAQAKLDAAKADLTLAQMHLSLTDIKAPFDGVIDRIPLKLGSLIDEGALLTSLSDNKNIFAYFNFTEVEYLDFKSRTKDTAKERVSLILANNQLYQYNGVIQTIEGQFDNNTGTIAVRAMFPNPNLLIRHGETGKVRLTVPIQHALIIPQKATYEVQDKIYVYVLDKDNIVRSRNIIVKQKLSNLYIIESGLTTTDQILLDGLQTVKEDEKVKTKIIPANEVIQSLQLIQ